MSAAAQLPLPIGALVGGKYKLVRVLGAGGMGVVAEAEQQGLGRSVAIKFLLRGGEVSAEIVERFMREARTVASLTSPNVVRVWEIDSLPTGEPYLVMELLNGRDLSAVLQEGGVLSVQVACSFILQTCRGLLEAHQARIVHRDLKPQNLFLTNDASGAPLIKILDVGIAKIDDGGLSKLTQTQSVMGSPTYMSPEQLRSSKHVDARADIWSLGVILFELLTDRLPYEADSMSALIFKVAQDKPLEVCTLRPEVPAGVGAAIRACLERAEADRPASVAQLAKLLAEYAGPAERAWADSLQEVSRYSVMPRAGESSKRVSEANTHMLGATDSEAATILDAQTRPTLIQRAADRKRLRIVAALAVVALVFGVGLIARAKLADSALSVTLDLHPEAGPYAAAAVSNTPLVGTATVPSTQQLAASGPSALAGPVPVATTARVTAHATTKAPPVTAKATTGAPPPNTTTAPIVSGVPKEQME